jgi:hypothetical protein
MLKELLGPQKVLWEGAQYPNAEATINLAEPVSEQDNGVVLVWSSYNPGSGGTAGQAVDYGWCADFIPKSAVPLAGEGTGWELIHVRTDTSLVYKYVYVSDTKITGNDVNRDSNFNGMDNRQKVLRYVLGV